MYSKFNTPTRSRRGGDQTRVRNEVLQHREGDIFGQRIGKVLLTGDIVDFHTPTGSILAHKVVVDLYMLRSSVDGWVLREEDRAMIVNVHGRRRTHVVP